MKISFAPVVTALACGIAFGSAQAAYIDLTTFASQGRVTLAPNLAVLVTDFNNGEAGVYKSVTNLDSFEYRLSVVGRGVGTVSLSLSTGPVVLANYSDLNKDFGWKTYDFQNPYSGSFALLDHTTMSSENVLLSLRNVGVADAVTAVPEPESYAMLLAGLGLTGVLARRKSGKEGRSATPA